MRKILILPHALIVLAALAACSKAEDTRPNIILISVDTLRWDYLNTYGYQEEGLTPAVSRLAENGMVYENAVATAGTTVPSHGSMLTGLYPRFHGARSNFHKKYPAIRTITEALQESGYDTGAFISASFMMKRGLDAGFDTDNTPFNDPVTGRKPQHGDTTVGQAIDWLDSGFTSDPIFMWLHLWEPHGPYDPTDWSRARLGEYEGFLRDGMSVEQARTRVKDIVNDPQHLRVLRTHYAGEVNLADQHLAKFLDELQARDLLRNSVVIFTADHGQGLGENGHMGHGAMHNETVIRVPLIVADFRDGAAGRSQTRAGTIDIAATIAAAAGLEEAFDYTGRSLLDAAALEADWPYFAEVELRTEETHKNWEKIKDSKTYDANAVAVYSGPFKMTYKHDAYTLYQTAPELQVAQQLEMADEPVMADYLQGLIESFHETKLDLSKDEISDEDLRVLQSLGYVQ